MNLRPITLTITSLTIAILSTTAQAASRVDNRQANQRARVQEGLQSGDFTKGEVHRLRHSARKIRRAERRAEKDDVITETEKAHLEKMQDARSHQIYRFKHNDNKQRPNQVRGDNGANASEPMPAPEPNVDNAKTPESH